MGRHTDEYFFDTKEYADLVRVKLYRFELQHKDSSLYGYYSIADDKLFIGQKSTFGGIYLQGTSTSDDVESLVKKFYDDFLQKYSAYSIRLPPSYLNNELNTISSILANLNSSVITERNQFKKIVGNSSDFLFAKTNRKILRRLKTDACKIKCSKKLNVDGYSLLEENRKLRDVNLSLSFEELQKQSIASEGKYVYFSCYNSANILIAYSVCVRISDNTLYIFYWGERPEYRKLSPVVMIADAAIQYCIKNKIKWLDAGISSLNGVLDHSLFDFKKRLGFEACDKNTIYSKKA